MNTSIQSAANNLIEYSEFKQSFESQICDELTGIRTICSEYTPTVHAILDHAINLLENAPFERPYYAYLGYRAYADEDADTLAGLCVALELYNMALLLQDDVFDGDEVRNGRRNIYGLLLDSHLKDGAGKSAAEFSAILVGNIFFGFAYSKLDRLTINEEKRTALRRCMHEANLLLNLGQLVDIRTDFSDIANLSTSSIIDSYGLKNQFNIEMPIRMGAILATGSDHNWPKKFARPLGVAIQIVNDNNLLTSDRFDSKTTSDLRNAKPTLALFLAWQKGVKEEKYFIDRLMGNSDITELEVIRLREIMMTTGAIERSNAMCKEYCDKSAKSLRALSRPDHIVLDRLLGVVENIRLRAY